MITVININHYPINYNLERNIPPTVSWKTKRGDVCAIWDGNWSQIFGNQILKVDKSIKYEVWRPDIHADQIYSHAYENGLVYRLFPSRKKFYLNGLRINFIYFSVEMIEELEGRLRNKEKIILHINAAFRYHDKLLLDYFFKKLPIVGQFYTKAISDASTTLTLNPLKYLHRFRISRVIKDYYQKLMYIIPYSESGMNYFTEKYNSTVFYRGNFDAFGIDFDEWDNVPQKVVARKELNIGEEEVLFFISARYVPEKQLDLLIMSFAKINSANIKLHISGTGDKRYYDYLSKLVIDCKLENSVRFLGFIPIQDLKKHYSACDYYVCSSKAEGGPISSYIAAYLEKPIITTRTGTAYEFLKLNNCGEFLDQNDPSDWHKIFLKAINEGKINICSRKLVAEYFNWDKIARFHAEAYKMIIQDFSDKKWQVK